MGDEQWYWEVLTSDCIGEVCTLISAVETADKAPIRTARQEVETYFGESQPWKAQGARCLETGQLIAFGLVRGDDFAGDVTITISGGVDPQWRRKGLGGELLERQIDLAHVLGTELGRNEYTIKMYLDERQNDLAQLVRTTNFTEEYRFIQVQKELFSESPTEAPWTVGNFIQIMPIDLEHYQSVYRLHCQVVKSDSNYADFRQQEIDFVQLGYEPRWCFVALDSFADRPEVAGYILCSRFKFNPGSQETVGVNGDEEGYIEELAVFPKWYRRGIEAALIQAALHQFAADGMSLAGADLIQNPDGSEKEINQIIREAGFQPVATTIVVSSKVSKIFPQV